MAGTWTQRVRPSGRYAFALRFKPGVSAVRVVARASAPFSQHRYLAPTSSATYVVPWR